MVAVILASEIDQFNSILPVRVYSIINNIPIQSINQQIVRPPHYRALSPTNRFSVGKKILLNVIKTFQNNKKAYMENNMDEIWDEPS